LGVVARGTPLRTGWRFLRFGIGAIRMGSELDEVRTYCLFIGHARSGHSVLGALLDAHPQIAISDELDALRYLSAGFGRRQLLFGSVELARRQAANLRRKGGLQGASYSYHVPNQAQGRVDQLRVVGDSQAGWTTRRLARDPRLLQRVEKTMAPLDLRFIHVIRNPFDNIATMMLRGRRTFDDAFAQYAANCHSIGPLSSLIGSERLLRLRHEQLVADPVSTLSNACAFLRVEPSKGYLSDSASIVYPRPSSSRRQIDWDAGRLERVRALISEIEFLSGYEFED
jgi:hypothetical protein